MFIAFYFPLLSNSVSNIHSRFCATPGLSRGRSHNRNMRVCERNPYRRERRDEGLLRSRLGVVRPDITASPVNSGGPGATRSIETCVFLLLTKTERFDAVSKSSLVRVRKTRDAINRNCMACRYLCIYKQNFAIGTNRNAYTTVYSFEQHVVATRVCHPAQQSVRSYHISIQMCLQRIGNVSGVKQQQTITKKPHLSLRLAMRYVFLSSVTRVYQMLEVADVCVA